MKQYLLIIPMFAVFTLNADGAVNNLSQPDTTMDIAASLQEQRDIATLENDIRILDSEISKCQKKKKGWIAATVIGSAGVVSTGVAAAVQGAKIKSKKGELADKNAELETLKTENAELEKKIKE